MVASLIALLFVLHASQPLSTTGHALSPSGFQAVKHASYRVVRRSQNSVPLTVSFRNAKGDRLADAVTFDPALPGLENPRSRIITSHVSGPVSLVADEIPDAHFGLSRLDERAATRAWTASVLFLLITANALFGLRRRVGIQAMALGLTYFVFLLPWKLPAIYSLAADNYYYPLTSLSLLHEGNWDLDEFGGTNGAAFRDDYRVRQGRGGHWFNIYPPGTPILILPVAALGEWLNDENPDVFRRAEMIAELAAKILSALSVALFFLIARHLTARSAIALGVTLIFAFATPQLGTHAGGLWSHNGSVFCALVGLNFCLWRGGKFAAYAALPLAFGFVVRPTLLPALALFGVVLLWRDWRKFPLYALLTALILGAFSVHSQSLSGAPLPIYYTGLAKSEAAHSYLPFLGTLVSPNCGLFVYCPILLLSFVGLLASWRRREIFYLAAGLVCLAEWIIASGNPLWWGGHSYGPRLLCEMIPFAVLLLIPAWEMIERSAWHRPALIFGLLACAWGIFVQTQALANPWVYGWSAEPNIDFHQERLWDWRDWQIFAG